MQPHTHRHPVAPVGGRDRRHRSFAGWMLRGGALVAALGTAPALTGCGDTDQAAAGRHVEIAAADEHTVEIFVPDGWDAETDGVWDFTLTRQGVSEEDLDRESRGERIGFNRVWGEIGNAIDCADLDEEFTDIDVGDDWGGRRITAAELVELGSGGPAVWTSAIEPTDGDPSVEWHDSEIFWGVLLGAGECVGVYAYALTTLEAGAEGADLAESKTAVDEARGFLITVADRTRMQED